MIIPIIHAASDLGELQEPINRVKIGLVDEPTASRSRTSVNQFWESLKVAIESWQFDFRNLVIFQDALPVGPPDVEPIEPKIVKELAEKRSVNHQLVALLMQRGAELIGTENPALLLKEYELVKRFLDLRLGDGTADDTEEFEIVNKQSEILIERDRFIAERIDETLVTPKVGLIFLGMLHRIEDHLPTSIQVSYPFGQPANQRQGSVSG